MPEFIDVSLLDLDETVQARATIDPGIVAEYAERLEDGVELPPVEACHDGSRYWVWDGFHRVLAHRRFGRGVCETNVRKGTLADAQWLAAGANAAHGLRRTSWDKRRAVEMALKHPKGAKLSDRAIADHCGVSNKTVAAVRKELESGGEIPHLAERVGTDGKTYPATSGGVDSGAQIAHLDDEPADVTSVPTWECQVCGKPNTLDQTACVDCGTDRDAVEEPDEDEIEEEERPSAPKPKQAVDVAMLGSPFRSYVKQLGGQIAAAEQMASDPRLGRYVGPVLTRIVADAKQLKATWSQLEPVCLCENCEGHGCTVCKQTGIWTRGVAQGRKR